MKKIVIIKEDGSGIALKFETEEEASYFFGRSEAKMQTHRKMHK